MKKQSKLKWLLVAGGIIGLIFLFAAYKQVKAQTPVPFLPTITGTPGGNMIMVKNIAGYGDILVDSKGMTLYTFANDSPGESTCTGKCLTTFPPLQASVVPAGGPGITGLLDTIVTSDGTTQVTYNGMPLYDYYKDEKPGDTYGDGMAGLWYVAKVMEPPQP
jgi:predicted lipoprotein with Yx(FWY)xxD motif